MSTTDKTLHAVRTVTYGKVRIFGNTYVARELDNWHGARVVVVAVPGARRMVHVRQAVVTGPRCSGRPICTAYRIDTQEVRP